MELLLWASFISFAVEVILTLAAVEERGLLARVNFIALGLALFVLAAIVVAD